MDPRLKTLAEKLNLWKLGLDDSFQFRCTACGKCCIGQDSRIPIVPKFGKNSEQQAARQAQPRTLQTPSKPAIQSPVAMF